jgi:hypothetical protein
MTRADRPAWQRPEDAVDPKESSASHPGVTIDNRDRSFGLGRDFATNPFGPAERGRTSVATFLQSALADGPIAVCELEIKARAAGLLGDHQRVTNSKLFKWAKKALGICSVRDGFGASGQWWWNLLPPQPISPIASPVGPLPSKVQQPNTYLPTHSDPERGSMTEPTGRHHQKKAPPEFRYHNRVPLAWITGVASLDSHRAPKDVPVHRWRRLFDDCNIFLNAREKWAARAAELGWAAEDLFGCRRHRPLESLGDAGLLWVTFGGKLIGLHKDWALFEVLANGSQRVFNRRPRRPDLILAWHLT